MKSSKQIVSFFTIAVIIWGLVAFYLGSTKIFQEINLLIFVAVVVFLISSITLLYFFNKPFKLFSDNIPLSTIALLHSWRIFAGWAFLAHADNLPWAFARNAGYGDLIAGFLGISIFIFGNTKRNLLIFNVIGLADFILAVGTGLTLTLLGSTEMKGIMTLPLIVIPLLGVPLSGYSHIVSLNRLLKAKDVPMNSEVK